MRNLIARKKEMLARMELTAKVKEDLKTVALGTSKINYLDPRITVAWCKLHEVRARVHASWPLLLPSMLLLCHWGATCGEHSTPVGGWEYSSTTQARCCMRGLEWSNSKRAVSILAASMMIFVTLAS